MFHKIDFVQKAQLSLQSETTVKFAENLQFTCSKFDTWSYSYHIKDIKGDFEITRIARVFSDGTMWDNGYDKAKNLFGSDSVSLNHIFYITANIEMNEMIEEMCAVPYQLQIPSFRLKLLQLCHFYKAEIVLPGYDGLKFTYYVMKTKANIVEIYIKNPYDLHIQGKKGDFKYEHTWSTNINLLLFFSFDSAVYPNSLQANVGNEPVSTSNASPESKQPTDESCPESVIPSELFSNAKTLLHKIAYNHSFADVFFITSDETKIPSHRCILAEYSNIFAKIFGESFVIPVEIDVDDFSADTIQCALNFIYDKPDFIKGKEMEVLKFAVKYDIQALIEACCSFFQESVAPTNVCEFIQIAYFNNFEELKQKCLKILVVNKKEIDASKIAELPKNIVVDAFCF